MRLQDVLDPYLDGVRQVVETHDGSLSMQAYLQLPTGVDYVRRTTAPSDAPDDRGVDADPVQILEVAMFGPDPARHGVEAVALDVIRRLRPGGRCAILIGYETHDLPFHRLLDDLTAASAQVVQVSSLDYDHVHAAAMVTVSGRIAMPRSTVGEAIAPDDGQGPDKPVLLRIANEFVFTDFLSRNLRAQMYRGGARPGRPSLQAMEQLTRDLEIARAETERAAAEAQRAKADAERATAETRRWEVDAARANAQAARVRTSSSFQLGRALVQAGRGPKGMIGLPGSVARIWRKRGRAERDPSPVRAAHPSPASARAAIASERSVAGPTGGQEDRYFLADTSIAMTRRSRPVVLGIVTDATAGSLDVDAVVNRVTPNDALLVLERCEPDLVLVEGAAFAPSHPWAYASDAAAERGVLLLRIIERAHRLSHPVVLIRDRRSVEDVGLTPLEARFDVVLDTATDADEDTAWSRGVQLARFNPLGAPTMRDGSLLFVGGLDPRAPHRERRFIEPVLSAAQRHDLAIWLDANAPDEWGLALPAHLRDTIRGRIASCDLSPIHRSASVILANPFTDRDGARSVGARTLEQLASGARMLSGPNPALAALAGASTSFVTDPTVADASVSEARDLGVPTPGTSRLLRRALFTGHATPVMLSRLSRRLGSSTDPLAGRSSTALMDLPHDGDVAAIVASMTRQVQRPTQAVFRLGEGATWPASATDSLVEAGIGVRVMSAGEDQPSLSAVATEVTTTWLTRWPEAGRVGPTWLIDLLVGGELSGADAVGYLEPEGFRFVAGLGIDGAIVRTMAIRGSGGSVAAFDAPEPRLPEWGSTGWRMLSVGPADPS